MSSERGGFVEESQGGGRRVEISREDLTRHYRALGDRERLAIEPEELTAGARACYEREMERRQLAREGTENDEPQWEAPPEVHAEWLASAAVACSFQVGSAQRYAEDAAHACAILEEAGIPSQVVGQHEEGAGPDLLEVMVPGSLSLKAASVLDCALFNAEMEETWRTHFERMSDEDLRALTAEDLCAGLLDRAARLKRVFEEEVARRRA